MTEWTCWHSLVEILAQGEYSGLFAFDAVDNIVTTDLSYAASVKTHNLLSVNPQSALNPILLPVDMTLVITASPNQILLAVATAPLDRWGLTMLGWNNLDDNWMMPQCYPPVSMSSKQ